MDKKQICIEIETLVASYQRRSDVITKWRKPLIGFASSNDPLFKKLKDVVSQNHLLPTQLLPGVRTVVAYFLPFDAAVGRSNIAGEIASLEWGRGYIESNELIKEISLHLKQIIGQDDNTVAVTPATYNFDQKSLISDWSHRHIAFIAGLGRFGVNNMLITESGCCGRYGSLLTTQNLEPDSRPETEFCLYRHKLSCLRCVERCPSMALSTNSFDRKICYTTCLKNEEILKSIGRADVCGKCLVGVPCTFINPVKNKLKHTDQRAAVNAKNGTTELGR